MREICMLRVVRLCLVMSLGLGVALGVAVAATAEEGAAPPAADEPALEVPTVPPAPVALAGNGKGKGGGAEECVCSTSVECGSYGGTLSCSDSTSPCSCLSVDRSCLQGERGWVQCNGDPKQYCDPCPCLYRTCETGRSCTTNEDCCGAIGFGGTCYQGQCYCIDE